MYLFSEVNIYPNPASNQLTIEANETIQKVSIYNLIGQEVLTKNPKSNKTILQINELPKGVYVVSTTIEGKDSTSKFIKE